ncbi:MAG: ABC transporter substrate-binding protein [Chloroflexi bacterium]|nr:ABC transporter substrate-binding protein [Chloroflexota bacterium]
MATNRRAFLRGAVAVGGAAGLALLSAACVPSSRSSAADGPSGSGQDRTFRLAYLTLGWAGIEVIHQLGLLEAKGWKIEWQNVDLIPGVVNAFGSGQVDLIDMSTVVGAQMYEQGIKLSVFGVCVGSLGAVLAGTGTNIRSLPELQGRKVAGIPGGTTTQELNAHIRRTHGFDLFTDTQFVQASAPPDVANLLIKGDVEAALIWEPTVTQLTQSGAGTVIATQQQLWEQTFGGGATEVHVMYVARPEIAQQYPALLRDVNAAQAQVAELWKQRDPKAVEAMVKVTKLPEDVVREAYGRTTPLSGLADQDIEAILQQLQFNREHGTILQSDVWTQDPATARREIFVQTG